MVWQDERWEGKHTPISRERYPTTRDLYPDGGMSGMDSSDSSDRLFKHQRAGVCAVVMHAIEAAEYAAVPGYAWNTSHLSRYLLPTLLSLLQALSHVDSGCLSIVDPSDRIL